MWSSHEGHVYRSTISTVGTLYVVSLVKIYNGFGILFWLSYIILESSTFMTQAKHLIKHIFWRKSSAKIEHFL